MRPNYFRKRELTFCDAVKMHKTHFIQGYTDPFRQRDSSKRIFDLDRSRRSGTIREIPEQARNSGSGRSDRIFRLDPNVRFFAPKFQVARCTAFSEMRLELLKKREELVVAVAGPDFAEGSELGRSRLARVLHGDSQQEVADDAAESATAGVVA